MLHNVLNGFPLVFSGHLYPDGTGIHKLMC